MGQLRVVPGADDRGDRPIGRLDQWIVRTDDDVDRNRDPGKLGGELVSRGTRGAQGREGALGDAGPPQIRHGGGDGGSIPECSVAQPMPQGTSA